MNSQFTYMGARIRSGNTFAYFPSAPFHNAFAPGFAAQQQIIKSFNASLPGLWKPVSLCQHTSIIFQMIFFPLLDLIFHNNFKLKFRISIYVLNGAMTSIYVCKYIKIAKTRFRCTTLDLIEPLTRWSQILTVNMDFINRTNSHYRTSMGE